MLLYGLVVAAIGSICAAVVRWPAMFVIGGGLSAVAFVYFVSTGAGWGSAFFYAVGSFFVLQIFYVLSAFAGSTRWRRVSSEKKDLRV